MNNVSLLTHFRMNPVRHLILSIVVALHFFFFVVLLISPHFVFHKKPHKPLHVKTIVQKPEVKARSLEKKTLPKNVVSTPKPRSTPKKEQPQVQKSTPSSKKEPAIADKRVSKTKQPQAKKNPSPQNRAKISDSLLKELEESIAKIENNGDKKIVKKKALVPIALQIDMPSQELSKEIPSHYTDILVNHLHHCLSLPDYGEVKIQLSLRQDGSVAKVVVLNTQSEKNKQYLETHLSRLQFPRFDGDYANKKEYTFILTFCNELY